MGYQPESQTLANTRPGAMTAVMLAARPVTSGPRELRVGRVENGAIVDDRQYRTALSYGRSEKATLMISSATTNSAPLFDRNSAGIFTLRVPVGARGRLALAAGNIDLAELAGTTIPLDGNARGKLVIGETTLLFQMVPAAPVPLRPRLTSAARGGLLSMIDWRFTSYVMASLCAHLFFVAWLDSADFSIDASSIVMPDQLARLIVEMPDPPEVHELPTDDVEPVDQATPENTVADNTTPSNPRPSPPSHDRATPTATPPTAEQTARMAADAANQAEILLVGTAGNASGRAFANLLRNAPTSDAQALLDGVRGVQIASGPAGILRARSGGGNGSGETGTLADLVARGNGATAQRVEGGVVRETRIIYTVSEPDGPPVQRSGNRDAEDVIRMLRVRRQAFQSCYEQRTRLNPDLHGKVGAVFTISEMGTVSGVRLTENTSDDAVLGVCVANVFQRIRFGEVAGSGDSTFAHALVFAPQN